MVNRETVKKDFFLSVIGLNHKSIGHNAIAYMIQFFLMMIVTILFVLMLSLINVGDFNNITSFSIEMFLGQLIQNIYNNISTKMLLLNGSVFLFMIMFYFILNTWFINFCFLLMNSYVEKNKINFGVTLSKSFSSKVFKLFFSSILQFFILFLALIFIVFIASLFYELTYVFGILLGIVLGAIVIGFFIRFILVNPIALFTDKSISLSVAESLQKIDQRKAINYFMYALLLGIIYALFSFAMSYVDLLLVGLGIVGQILSFILSLMINLYVINFIVSVVLCVYYLHFPASAEEQDLDLEDNLVV